jgi:DNA-binding IclR family transcriptional regulator
MSSLSRMLAVLDLITAGTPSCTAEAVAQNLDCSLPTAYRYVRELAAAGLLRRGTGGTYVLGPRAIELDYQMRVTDPVLLAGQGAFQTLCEATGCDVVLAGVYGDRIITIHQLQGSEGVSATYGRGRRMPLFRGMLSKTLLAAMPRAQLRKLYALHQAEAAQQAFAKDWDTLLANLKAIRSAGYCISYGELDPELVGVALPVVSREHEVLAALGLIITKQRFAASDLERMLRLLRESVAHILAGVSQGPVAPPARTVAVS